jgi:hypothetical protein
MVESYVGIYWYFKNRRRPHPLSSQIITRDSRLCVATLFQLQVIMNGKNKMRIRNYSEVAWREQVKLYESDVSTTKTRTWSDIAIPVCSVTVHSLYSSFVGPWPLFCFLILYTVDMTPWTGVQPVARPRPTRRTTQTQNKRIHTSMPWVGFEPTILAFKRAKMVHALAREVTAIGNS